MDLFLLTKLPFIKKDYFTSIESASKIANSDFVTINGEVTTIPVSSDNQGPSDKKDIITDIITVIIQVSIMYIAGYLSWGCSQTYSIPLRIFFAISAAFFGTFYIIGYLLFRADLCMAPKK